LQALIALPEAIDLESSADSTTTPIPAPAGELARQNSSIGVAPAKPPIVAPFPVQIGTSFDGGVIQWDPYRDPPNHLNNFSVLVTGDAGSGKTQTMRVLIDAACRQGLAVTIFDFKADYCGTDFAMPDHSHRKRKDQTTDNCQSPLAAPTASRLTS
jgi:hypothetical protein